MHTLKPYTRYIGYLDTSLHSFRVVVPSTQKMDIIIMMPVLWLMIKFEYNFELNFELMTISQVILLLLNASFPGAQNITPSLLGIRNLQVGLVQVTC